MKRIRRVPKKEHACTERLIKSTRGEESERGEKGKGEKKINLLSLPKTGDVSQEMFGRNYKKVRGQGRILSTKEIGKGVSSLVSLSCRKARHKSEPYKVEGR